MRIITYGPITYGRNSQPNPEARFLRWLRHTKRVKLWRKRNTARVKAALKEQGLSTNVYEWRKKS